MTDRGVPQAELSSITTALDELGRRVTSIAERNSGTELDWLATELFQVERSLGEARRRMATLRDKARRAG